MPRLVYACKFEFSAESGLEEVVDNYREWLLFHYRNRGRIGNFVFDPFRTSEAKYLPDRHSLSSTVYKIDLGEVIRIRWLFPDDKDRGLCWINEARIGQFGNRCSVEHIISIESVEYNLTPPRLHFGSPRVVRNICARTPQYIGKMRIQATPYVLRGNQLNDLVDLLETELRRIPIVLLSSYARGEGNAIDADRIAKNLAGIAIVVKIEDPEIVWDFVDEVGRQLSCFDGAARIYWPGFSKHSNPRNHRLFLGTWIEKVGATVASKTIERTVFAVAAFRFVPDRDIADVMRFVETAERQRQLDERKIEEDDLYELCERTLAQLDEAQDRIQELEAENKNLRYNSQIYISELIPGEPEETSENDETPQVSNVHEAVIQAAKRTRNLEFLPTAYSSAKNSPFQRPLDIYAALKDLDGTIDDWRERKGSIVQHLRNRGLGKRSSMHISKTTRGKYREHYEFFHKGTKQLFQPHITIGSGDYNSCASIHFIFEEEKEKMIVAYVGKHLPNTKT